MHDEKWQDKEDNADPSLDFNLDDFLKSDAVPDLLPVNIFFHLIFQFCSEIPYNIFLIYLEWSYNRGFCRI